LISFTLPAAGKKVLNYSALCVVGGPTSGWGDIDIYVNGVVVAPTAGIEAFCHGGSQWSRHSIILVMQGQLGLNTVQIVGRVYNGGTFFSLGKSALVIHD
jgi:hypothetical protein